VQVCDIRAATARQDAEILDGTPAGTRLHEMSRYFACVGRDLARAAEHWRWVVSQAAEATEASTARRDPTCPEPGIAGARIRYRDGVTYPPPYPAPYGMPPSGYGRSPYGRRPSTAPAYLTASLFLLCGALSLVFAIISWDGTTGSVDVLAAVIGMAFSESLTGNVDFAISASMAVACTTLTFAVVQLFRLGFVRWILAFVGGVVTLYYGYALIYLLAHDAARVIGLVVVAFLLWLAATILAVLPHTGRARRGYRPNPPPNYPGYPGYLPNPGYPGYPPQSRGSGYY
jgi:hypothetical protein